MASAPTPAGFGFADLPRRPLPPLEPGAWALTGTAVDKWLARAKAGDELVYARGPRLLLSDGVRRLQEQFDAGAVTFKTRRIAADDVAYIAERLAGAARPNEALRLARPAPPAEDADEVAMLMAILRRRAARNQSCPTNRELGAEIGELLDQPPLSADRVSYLLRKQVSLGKLRVDALGKGVRIVTLTATGQRTAAA